MKYLSCVTIKNISWASLGLLVFNLPANAFQVDITSVNTTLITGGNSGTANGFSYDGDQLRVDSFVANGETWQTTSPATAFVRRNNRGGTVADDNIVWHEQISSSTDLRGPIPTTTEAALNGNNLYTGSDNLFVNSGETNQSSIERVDYIFDSSAAASNTTGLTVFERGGSTVHDSFQVALILGVDGSNNPTSFSDLLTINAGWGTTNLEPNTSAGRTILKDDGGNQVYADSGTTSQDLGGVLISLDQFSGITGDVFGYALFGGDVNAANGDITDVTSAAYPNSASAQQGGLGLDPIAINTGLVQAVPLEFSPGLGLLLSGGGLLAFNFLKKKKIKKLEL